MEVAGSRRPAGETCGGMSCGDWGNFFLSCAVLRAAVFSAAAVCRCSLGLLSGEKEGFHSFQTTPLWLLPHCFPPLQPLQSLHIGSKPSTGPDGVIDALTSAWDGQLGAGWLAGLGPVGYSSCLFQSSFPVLTNESCSFRGSHLGSHPVYWPGATSDFVSVSDQLCQLSLSRGLSLSSSLLVHGMASLSGPRCGLGLPQRGPSELAG